MFPATNEEVAFGKPHARHRCHVDPYVTDLYVSIDCKLTQGFELDENGNVIRDENGNPIRKPAGVIHLGNQYDDPVMVVKVGLRGPLLHHLCGWLCVRVHLECIGTGPEKDYTVDMQRIDGTDGIKCCDKEDEDWCYYDFEVTIPKSDFKADDGSDCGEFCCFAVTASTKDRCGHPGHIGCWCKGPCVMIHQAPEN